MDKVLQWWRWEVQMVHCRPSKLKCLKDRYFVYIPLMCGFTRYGIYHALACHPSVHPTYSETVLNRCPCYHLILQPSPQADPATITHTYTHTTHLIQDRQGFTHLKQGTENATRALHNLIYGKRDWENTQKKEFPAENRRRVWERGRSKVLYVHQEIRDPAPSHHHHHHWLTPSSQSHS